MVRTTLSFCVLFGFLVAGVAVLQQAGPEEASPTGQSPATSDVEHPQPRVAARPAERVSFISTPVSAEDLSLMLVSFEERITDEDDSPTEAAEPKTEPKLEEKTEEKGERKARS